MIAFPACSDGSQAGASSLVITDEIGWVIGCLKSEVRSPKHEARSTKHEVGSRRSEVGGRKRVFLNSMDTPACQVDVELRFGVIN